MRRICTRAVVERLSLGYEPRARARRLPSCIAWTRAIGIARPSSIRSAGSDCGPGRRSAHGLPSRSTAGTVWMVKSVGVTRSSSSHYTAVRDLHDLVAASGTLPTETETTPLAGAARTCGLAYR